MKAQLDGLNTKQVAKYVFLPGVVPRIKELFGSGFSYLAFLIALIYQGVRILPPNHPYTNPSNIGRFGLRDVLVQAANRVVVSTKTLDQVLIFFAVIAGLIILVFQILAFVLMIFMNNAWAGGGLSPVTNGMFTTQFPETDIAFQILDYVFGVPGIFGSGPAGTPIATDPPSPLHQGLHGLLQFYNVALLIVAAVVFIYYIVVVVAETAQTGTPFGKRFNSIYAPLRLVFAIALLVPLNYGLNASQYITLISARLGSGFASNAWILFNRDLDNTLGVETASLIAEAKMPELNSLVIYMSVVHACKEAYRLNKISDNPTTPERYVDIEAYIVVDDDARLLTGGISYPDALAYYAGGDIIVVFGELDDTRHGEHTGYVRPYCGTLAIPAKVADYRALGIDINRNPGLELAEMIQAYYYLQVVNLWVGTPDPQAMHIGQRFAHATPDLTPGGNAPGQNNCFADTELGDAGTCASNPKPPDEIKTLAIDELHTRVETFLANNYTVVTSSMDLSISDELLQRGWGGAGIWYNRIAETNGVYMGAVHAIPWVKDYPEVMEQVRDERMRFDETVTGPEMFSPNISEGAITLPNSDMVIARSLDNTYQYWRNSSDATFEKLNVSNNFFWDTINMIFGTEGLHSIRDNEEAGIHPLAQLTIIGKGLIDSTMRNLAAASASAFLGGFASIASDQSGSAALMAMSSFFVTIATMSLSMGFVLYYIVPFLPFMYFFFAVSGWVKGIFEAMVGAPLWALAHLRIDGDGFPGGSASNGYFLIFEIFLRPILTIFGLVGGMAIFAAMTHILNELFDLVILNTTGFDTTTAFGLATPAGPAVGIADRVTYYRGSIDEFFFTIMYTIIVYMMGVASFKLIDMVPNNILRWIGGGVAAFNDSRQDPTQGLVQYAAIGGATIGGRLAQATTSAAAVPGRVAAGLTQAAGPKGGAPG